MKEISIIHRVPRRLDGIKTFSVRLSQIRTRDWVVAEPPAVCPRWRLAPIGVILASMRLSQVVGAEALFGSRFGLAQDIEYGEIYQYPAMDLYY